MFFSNSKNLTEPSYTMEMEVVPHRVKGDFYEIGLIAFLHQHQLLRTKKTLFTCSYIRNMAIPSCHNK